MFTFPVTFFGGGATREFLGFSTAQVASQTTYTFGAFTMPRAGRFVLCVVCDAGVANRTFNSATVNGVGATIHVNQAGGKSSITTSISAICSIPLSAGSTGNIAVTFSNNMTVCNIAGYALLDLISGTPTATAGNATSAAGAGATSLSTSINIPGNGILIGVASANNATITLSGVTQDGTSDVSVLKSAVGSNQQMTAETGRSVSASHGGTASAFAIAFAAWN